PFIQIIIMAFFLFIILLSVLTRRVYKEFIIGFYFFYFLLFFYLLLFKNIGIRGFEGNPLSFISDSINGDPIIVWLNLLMFIPLGWILALNKRNLVLVILGVFLIEVAQYVFYLGIFDAGDILTNTAGFVVGTIIKKGLFHQDVVKIVSLFETKRSVS
ncbi:VanZ family protein, partial [Enterococcus villorum]